MYGNRYICTNLEIIQPMAKLNYSESGPLTSGKIGGQQIIKNRHGVILQSISQPPSFGTVEQKKQRFVTNTLAQKWKQLTALQKQSFADSATTWFKKSKSGQLINQTPYGLFLFLHQNSALIGEDGPLFGVDYESLVEPQAYLTNKNQFSIMVKSDNTVNDYEYLVIIDPRSTGYRVAQQNNELLVGKLTALELDQGIDVAPMIQNHFDFAVNMSLVSVRITPIEIGTGRRGEEISWLYKESVTELTNAIRTGTTVYSQTFSHDGSAYFYKNSNGPITDMRLTQPFDISNPALVNDYTPLAGHWRRIFFAPDGMTVYVSRQAGVNTGIWQYALTSPYDVSSFTLIGSIPSPNDIIIGAIYVDYNGYFLIYSTSQGTYRYDMLNPHDISTAIFNSQNTAIRSGNENTFFYSTDGNYWFEATASLIAQYKLSTPFSIFNQRDNPIKLFNYFLESGFQSSNFISFSIPYNGLYFSISTQNTALGFNNIAVFKFATPFNL